eukprot:Gb_31008 [translate_table: standard]
MTIVDRFSPIDDWFDPCLTALTGSKSSQVANRGCPCANIRLFPLQFAYRGLPDWPGPNLLQTSSIPKADGEFFAAYEPSDGYGLWPIKRVSVSTFAFVGQSFVCSTLLPHLAAPSIMSRLFGPTILVPLVLSVCSKLACYCDYQTRSSPPLLRRWPLPQGLQNLDALRTKVQSQFVPRSSRSPHQTVHPNTRCLSGPFTNLCYPPVASSLFSCLRIHALLCSVANLLVYPSALNPIVLDYQLDTCLSMLLHRASTIESLTHRMVSDCPFVSHQLNVNNRVFYHRSGSYYYPSDICIFDT